MRFDYVIVGAGSAGCVLAARLSEDPRVQVLLLEAGPEDRHPWLHIPIGYGRTFRNPAYSWQFQTEPEEGTAGRSLTIPRGKVLGGSSAINGLGFTRGQAEDYDAWAQMGNRGWSFAEVLPYFKRMERFEGGGDAFRGGDGPLPVSYARDRWELCEVFIAAAARHGIPYNPDPNGARQDGINYFQMNTRNGLRHSTAKAYLNPVRARPNLTVETHAEARRLLFEGRRCIGLAYEVQGRPRQARAGREVILAGGSVGSPQLLELSGVGDGERLKALGIEVVHHLPGVGENLHDHYLARSVWRVRRKVTFNERMRGWRLAAEAAKFVLFRRGLLAICAAQLCAFVRSRPELDLPDLELTITPWSFEAGKVGVLEREPGMSIVAFQLRPESRGSIHLASPDPKAPPAIRPNYLATETDRRVLIDGLRLARRIVASPELDPYRGEQIWPAPHLEGDAELLAHARETGASVGHLAGTCKMGPATDAGAVVGPDLKVHGLAGLRVADASILPAMISGHTNAPVIMIGEKASDLVREAA
jgi:choline dehydrogenase